MTEFRPQIDPAIWLSEPSYRALSITVRGFSPEPGRSIPQLPLSPPAWMDAHLEAWRQAFRRFGSNPKKTACSAEALWKRVQKDGSLPAIDPVVDFYNSLSVRYGAPFGGEDLDHYQGSPRLGLALGHESFDTARNGELVIEHPDAGEVIWQDNAGVTCRRWNWRQCRRTGLTANSRNLWFIIDRLDPMPISEILRAGDELTSGLRELCPSAETTIDLLEPRSLG